MTNTKKVTMIDPPSGWKYGFPKPIPSHLEGQDTIKWLLEQGYPQQEIDLCGKHFYVRCWEEVENVGQNSRENNPKSGRKRRKSSATNSSGNA